MPTLRWLSSSPLASLAGWLTTRRGPVLEQALRGGVWLLVGDAFTKTATIVKLAILGRLLAPGDFGLMAIAMAVLKALSYLSETGLTAALIHRRDEPRQYLDTLWCVQLARSIALAGLLVASAPLAGWFFVNPHATPIVRAVALVLLLRGLVNPAVVLLRKELDFQRVVRWRATGVVAGLAAGVSVAVVAPSAWALVASVIAAEASDTALSYWALRYRPRFAFDRARARELFNYGRWMFWVNAVGFVSLYADSMTVGRLLGTTALGFYQMAFDLAMLPSTVIGTHVRGVMFPAFAKMADTREQRRSFLLALGLVSAVALPVAVLVTGFADTAIALLLGRRWLSAAAALRVLAWSGAAGTLSCLVDALLQARGRPDLVVKLGAGQVALWAVLFYPLVTRHGIEGMALAVTVAQVLPVAVKVVCALRLVEADARGTLRALRPVLAGAAPCAVAVALVTVVPPPTAWSATVAATSAIACLAILLRRFRRDFGLLSTGADLPRA